MHRERTDRTLARALTGIAVAFAVIFTLNGIGFALRSGQVGAREKGRADARFAHAGRLASQARPDAWLVAHGLGRDASEEATDTDPGKSGDAPGHVRNGQGPLVPPGQADGTPQSGDGTSGTAVVPGEAEPGADGDSDTTGELPPAITCEDPELPPAPSSTVTPTIVPGNPPLCEGGFKVESPSCGTHTYTHTVDGRTVTVTIRAYLTANGQAFDWTSSWPIERIVVKGGSLGANVYAYDPPATADTGLHAPQANDKNPHWAGLSYVAFCFGEAPASEVSKTFELTYPTMPEGAHAWVKYRLGDGDFVTAELMPAGNGLYTFVLPHIPAGSLLRGEWLLTYGDITEKLGEFCEVLLADKTNKLSHVAQVGGVKYEDLDGDGMRDEGEPGIEGWKITLLRKAWVICDVGTWEPYTTVLTAADGSYSFEGLPPGLYRVEEEMREGWKQTDAPEKCEFEIGCETTVTGLDFGNLQLPDLSVLKFEDLNGNGVRDALPGGGLEPVLSGWTFSLKQGSATIAEKTTGEDGIALFADLDLGDYVLDEVARSGWSAVTPLPCTVTMEASGRDVSLSVANQRIPTTTHVDLAIEKASNPATVAPGAMVTYRLTYRNLGDEPATDFKIVDDFDQALIAEVVNAGGGVVDAEKGTITWTFAGPLSQADGPKSVVYTLRVKSGLTDGTMVDNTAVITHPEDTDPSNNEDDASVEVVVEPRVPDDDDEPYLPFTGGDFGLVALLAGLSAGAGGALRLLGRERRQG